MSMHGVDRFVSQVRAWVVCGVALLGCTDVDTLEGQLMPAGSGGSAGTEALPTGGASGGGGIGGVAGMIGGAAGTIGGEAGMSGGQGGNMSGGQGGDTTAACMAAGCACASSTSCGSGLICDGGTCRGVLCGDARADAGEECDDGNDVTTDACPMGCLNARCGDGFTHAGAEACDDGNDVDDDACSNACVAKPYNVAFLTSTTYQVGSLGGLAGADAACAARATAAGLPGTFVAWIDSASSSIASRLGSARGWVRPDGVPFLDQIADPRMFYLPNIDELGARVRFDGIPAIGAFTDGTFGASCAGWTSEAADQVFEAGEPSMGYGAWNGGWSPGDCSEPFRLYCFQTDHANALTFEPATGRLAFLSEPWAPSGGLAAADALCNANASAASLSGTFKALLGTSSASAASRFSLAGEPWVRPDGVRIVAEAQDLFEPAAMLLAPMQVTADKRYLRNAGGWSGGKDLNAVGTATCNDWTSASNATTGTGGRAHFGWVEDALAFDGNLPCNQAFTRLYCLQDS